VSTTQTHYTPADVAAAVAQSKREILADIAAGTTPADVATFSALHDYTDANCYGGLCDDDGPMSHLWDVEDSSGCAVMLSFGAEVQDAVHQWLVAGREDRCQESTHSWCETHASRWAPHQPQCERADALGIDPFAR
jgi:hypothetical protein